MQRDPGEPLFGPRTITQRPPAGNAGEISPPATPAATSDRSDANADVAATLQRIERLLADLSGRVETLTRERHHRPFSPAWFLGTLLQILVVGFVIAAIADRVFQAPLGQQLADLMFAGVFQLGALTAFLLARK